MRTTATDALLTPWRSRGSRSRQTLGRRVLAIILLVPLTGPARAHPLDALTGEEIKTAVAVIRSHGLADAASRYPLIKLLPPDKTAVWGWSAGQEMPRRASVVLLRGADLNEVVVDVTGKRLVSLTARSGVQSNIATEEWTQATELVKADPRWQAAMHRRGITDFQRIFCDVLSVGRPGRAAAQRLLKVPCYDARDTTNVYGRPIEGVMSTVDLTSGTVLAVNDTGVVPISSADPSLEEERQPTLRARLRPVVSAAPAGFNFTVDRNVVRWGAWSFHLSFDQRVGPIVSTVRYRDGDRDRPILYQGHISEMFVPYMDPDPNWSFRSYMDVGEYGFGILASTLAAGADCPSNAVMLPVTLPSYSGEPGEPRNLMCAFERNTTRPLWRRFEILTGAHEARSDVELVVRTIPTVGNYDYLLDWVFNHKGEIRLDVGATGIAAARGTAAATADRQKQADSYGAQVGRNLTAPYHDHYLSFRLDLDVDGQANTFVRERLATQKLPGRNDRRSVWTRRPAVAETELAIEPSHKPELWRVENRAEKTPLGYHPSFEIVGEHSATSLLSTDDPVQRRAAFSSRPLWITAYKPTELYAAGDYPNQGPGGEGLPRYVNAERVDGRDLVVWYTLGFHHVTRPEDWPVLPTVRHSLTLRPHRFFIRNPGLDIPEEFDETGTGVKR